jgi:hypothetical protein
VSSNDVLDDDEKDGEVSLLVGVCVGDIFGS